MGKIILTSQGLCTQMRDRLIHRAISDMGDREKKDFTCGHKGI